MSSARLAFVAALGDLVVTRLREPATEHDVGSSVVRLAREHLACDEVGITVRDARGTTSTLASTDAAVERLDGLQDMVREGPALQTWSEDADLVVSDPGRRWPRWGAAASELGIHGVLTVRLPALAARRGVLSLYSCAPRSIASDDFDAARIFAEQASVGLRVTGEVWHLNQAIATRTVIGQAVGVLMHRFQIDADQAFAVLTRAASHEERKVHVVAAELVTTGRTPRCRGEGRRSASTLHSARTGPADGEQGSSR